MVNKNSHGLARDIPEDIKLKIRQKSGFGCIFCGNWIYQYEHILPEYVDANIHNPDKICLLCATHHQKVTIGRISKNQVLEQYKHPFALQRGYANEYLEMSPSFQIALGRILFVKSKDVLKIDDEKVIYFSEPTSDEPIRLNAKFFDNKGNVLLQINNNELIGYSRIWDINQIGKRTIFRRKHGDIALQMNIASEHILEFERVNMEYGSAKLVSNSDSGKIYIQARDGGTIDFPAGQIITEGLEVKYNQLAFNKGIFIGVQEGLSLGKMDYEDFIKTGQIHSVKEET